MNIDK